MHYAEMFADGHRFSLPTKLESLHFTVTISGGVHIRESDLRCRMIELAGAEAILKP
jgi:hypothetical protein